MQISRFFLYAMLLIGIGRFMCFFQAPGSLPRASSSGDSVSVGVLLEGCDGLLKEARAEYNTSSGKARLLEVQSILNKASRILETNPKNQDSLLRQTAGLFTRLGEQMEAAFQYEHAVTCFEKARRLLLLRADTVATPEIADATWHLGIAYLHNSDPHRAISVMDTALALASQAYGANSADVGSCYNYIGAAYQQLGDPYEAIRCFQKQYRVLWGIHQGPSPYLSYPLSGIADCYAALGQYDKAADCYEQMLRLGKGMGGYQHIYWSMLSGFYVKAGNIQNALRAQQKALDLLKNATSAENSPEIATSNRQFGEIYLQAGRYETADSFLNRALLDLQATRGPYDKEIGLTLLSQARLCQSRQQVDKAIDLCQQALPHFCPNFNSTDRTQNPGVETTRFPDLLLEALELKGDLWKIQYAWKGRNSDSLEAAYSAYAGGIACLTAIQHDIVDEASKAAWVQHSFPLYEKAIQTATALAASKQNQDWLRAAFQCIEKSKATILLESVRQSGAQVFARVPEHIQMQERTLRAQKASWEAQVEMLLFDKEEQAPEVAAARDSIVALETDYRALLKTIEREQPQYFQLKYDTAIASVEAIQQRLPDNNTLILEYFWGDDALYALALTCNSIRCQVVPNNAALHEHIQAFNRFVRQSPSTAGYYSEAAKTTYVQSACWLFQHLVEPAIPNTGISKLVIMTDGLLNGLPFQALLTEKPSEEQKNLAQLPYLLHRYEVSYAYSSTLLLQPLPTREAPRLFGGFAPEYGGAGNAYVSRSQNSIIRTEPVLSTGRGGLTPLLHNTNEVDAIARMTGGTPWLGKKATEGVFKNHAGEYRILHLAMHAMANDSFPNRSQLIFSENADSLEDGRLHVYEIFALPLMADLVVLSACETGKGRSLRGEGVLSLGRAFRFAGCPNIILSNWEADDAYAARIMQGFYHHFLQHKNLCASLETAKREFVVQAENERMAHPYYWANFVLMGSHFPEPNGISLWWWAAAIPVVLLPVFFRKKLFPRSL